MGSIQVRKTADVVRFCDYGRATPARRDLHGSAIIIVLPVVRVEAYPVLPLRQRPPRKPR